MSCFEVENLLLEAAWLGKVKGDLVSRNFVVDLGKGLELTFDFLSVEGVEVDLDVLLSVEGYSG